MKRDINIDECISVDEVLTKEEARERLEIINLMVKEGKPLSLEKAKEHGLKLLDNIAAKGKIVLDETGNYINFCYPVSALATNHHVYLDDGREFTSMCAIDALGAAFVFGQNATIKSKCSKTGNNIEIRVEDGKIKNTTPSTVHAIHVDLSKFKNWAASC